MEWLLVFVLIVLGINGLLRFIAWAWHLDLDNYKPQEKEPKDPYENYVWDEKKQELRRSRGHWDR